MTLAEQHRAEALRLRAQGLGKTRIARALGISESTVHRIINPAAAESHAVAAREAKRRRTGRCACGAVTRYAGHGEATVSTRCHRCAMVEVRKRQQGTGRTQRTILAAVDEGYSRWTDLKDATGLERGRLSACLNRLVALGILRRVERGVYERGER